MELFVAEEFFYPFKESTLPFLLLISFSAWKELDCNKSAYFLYPVQRELGKIGLKIEFACPFLHTLQSIHRGGMHVSSAFRQRQLTISNI
jgi:hypothetical protein